MKSFKFFFAGLAFWGMQNHAMNIDPILNAGQERSVSYIYYPATDLGVGHAELEVDGAVGFLYDFYGIHGGMSQLQRNIGKATSEGYPFFRFVFDVNDEEFQVVNRAFQRVKNVRNVGEDFYYSCSDRALKPLIEAGICSVPLPIRVIPLASATYLAGSRLTGLSKIKRIEYYGNPSLMSSSMKIIKGVIPELTVMVVGSYIIGRYGSMLYRLSQGNEASGAQSKEL